MLFKNLLPLAAFIATAIAAVPSKSIIAEREASERSISARDIGDYCLSASLNASGRCEHESHCQYDGFTFSGGCPRDPGAVKCCVRRACATNIGTGICRNTNHGCAGGTWVTGKCPGDSTIRCCVN
ncbi:hypothetical protein BJ508DRAFT_226217 [Ascobolus immersus RN42]|uniref:Uncharacterized protein n=1 Tax=Ascobolus immersus RN42 TaxID=1160509 RepID=A0A3N4I4F7_ASCIM|nr:hypothetical protein BJ508DRAFT_226217 [Ascobolus immersus RN42]